MQFNDFASDYLAKLKESIDLLPIDTLRDITQLLHQAYREGKQVIVMGNGGSASNSSHFHYQCPYDIAERG